MRAIRRFIVQPVFPEPLRELPKLAKNLRWVWHQETKDLFRAIDPDLWSDCRGNPLKLLSQVSSERLSLLSNDRRFLRNLERVSADLEDYMTADSWYQGFAANHPQAPKSIAYFSAEFGIDKVLPQYSGGLGILAGDHLKSASDTGTPIIGVGLLYQHGYFVQSLNAQGWQQERYPVLDPNELPVTLLEHDGKPAAFTIRIGGRDVKTQIWTAQVGRVPLLLMDTNVEGNASQDRLITDKLYGGGSDHRLEQEVLLGIGGVRALRIYCELTATPDPQVYHANEGHAGFLGLERIREYMSENGDDFDTALEKTRAGTVFTTHTPVPAGIDRFTVDQVRNQFADFAPLEVNQIIALGIEDYAGGDPSRFNMAAMGLRLSQRANGVSELHGQVSREMFAALWPGFDTSEVPITSVTNGVHQATWIHPELLELLESPAGNSSSVVDGYDWNALEHVEDNTLWTLKRQMRGEMIAMARQRLTASCKARKQNADWVATALNPHTLTIGFARRAASYKRLTLMLNQPERLKKLLTDPQRPVQIVIAGKAHPADDGGKGLIQQMVHFSEQEDVKGCIVFLPDYDISLSRPLFPGCDVWLNNPLRPLEACGTSGMKAALNMAMNLSVRDGWWDEWFDDAWGWQIPSAEGIADPLERDQIEADAIYDIIEREIVPAFYERDANGIPQRWVTMMRSAISGLGPKVLATRMVRDYVTKLYTPAAIASAKLEGNSNAAQLASWKLRVRNLWPNVHVERVEANVAQSVEVGCASEFTGFVNLGGLSPEDVEVELVAGQVNDDDELEDVHIVKMSLAESPSNSSHVFKAQITSHSAGVFGFTVRVVPWHPLLASRAEMGLSSLA